MMNGIKAGLVLQRSRYGFLSERGSDCRCFPSCKAGAGSDALCFHRHLADLYRDCIYVPVLRASFGPEIGGAAYVQTSMAENLGAFGPVFLSAAMSLFAFTTLIGNYSYCEGCLRFILNRAVSRGGILAFRSLRHSSYLSVRSQMRERFGTSRT